MGTGPRDVNFQTDALPDMVIRLPLSEVKRRWINAIDGIREQLRTPLCVSVRPAIDDIAIGKHDAKDGGTAALAVNLPVAGDGPGPAQFVHVGHSSLLASNTRLVKSAFAADAATHAADAATHADLAAAASVVDASIADLVDASIADLVDACIADFATDDAAHALVLAAAAATHASDRKVSSPVSR